jgi:hypothetical protein
MKIIKECQEYSHKKFDEQIEELEKYCSKNSSIKKFVEKLLEIHNFRNGETTVAYYLSDFIWELTNFSTRCSLANSCHFDGGWVASLNSFIGNYFLDDAYFYMVNSSYENTWEAISYQQIGIQDPEILILCAEDNARMCKEIESEFKKKNFKFKPTPNPAIQQMLDKKVHKENQKIIKDYYLNKEKEKKLKFIKDNNLEELLEI